MNQNTFNVYVMSYKRSDKILTQNLFDECTYVVREEEAEKYRAAGVKKLLVIPESSGVFSFMSTLYWIINNTPEDLIFIADDDIEKFLYRMDISKYIEDKDGNPDKRAIIEEIMRIGQLLVDLNLGLAIDQPSTATYNYTAEFRFMGIPGHMRWINKKAFKATYTRKDDAASDVDMMLQEVLKNRVCLQTRYFCAKAGMDLNDGASRNREGHVILQQALKNKWGKYYNYDFKKNFPRLNIKR